ncbi:hypothetical protein Dimus_031239 [Dionaea muscipula]
MWGRASHFFHGRPFCSTSSEFPSLYSFLQPSLFTLKPSPPPSRPPSTAGTAPTPLTLEHKTALETTLTSSLAAKNTDEAWKSFKSLTHHSSFPSKSITNSLIAHLSSVADVLNLKRAFASIVYLIEKNPSLLDHETLRLVLISMAAANTPSPAFALVKCLFKNRVFVPFDVWGDALGDISRKNGSFDAFLCVFLENCRVSLDEKLEFMKPGLSGFNAALEGCCWVIESVSHADRVIELMSLLDVRPDESSFGFLGYLYSVKGGLEEKIIELEDLMRGLGFNNRTAFLSNVVRGYAKSGDLASVSKAILHSVDEGNEHGSQISEETYCEVVRGYLKNASVKDLADLITEAQALEPRSLAAERTVGFGIVNACVILGMLDKAHSILDEMNACGVSVGLGVYLSILNACIKEQRTAVAAQLVAEISDSGLQLDVARYDSLIEASMSCQDFQSVFSLFRDMRREGRISDLKGSYLTIMTGLTENNRPELMAAFLDEVVEDPRIEVGTHDWNSIIHAFCKAERLEDARRTFRRMIFLQFEPNEQTYLSLINGYVSAEKYFYVLMLWNEVRKREAGFKLEHSLVDAFLYALVKGGFFDAVMQVVEKSQEMKIFVDKWRYKQAYMECHKKLKISKLRKRNFRKLEAVIAFKNWAGLNA